MFLKIPQIEDYLFSKKSMFGKRERKKHDF